VIDEAGAILDVMNMRYDELQDTSLLLTWWGWARGVGSWGRETCGEH
jgi:hypothetical protein